jgi:hypothetical protein
LSPWGWKKTRNRTFCWASSSFRRAFFLSCRQVFGQVLEPELEQAAAQRAGVLWPEDAEERTALLEEAVHGRTQSVGRDRIELLEPALDGRITTHVHVECEPVGPEWHARELPRDHRVGADDGASERARSMSLLSRAGSSANDLELGDHRTFKLRLRVDGPDNGSSVTWVELPAPGLTAVAVAEAKIAPAAQELTRRTGIVVCPEGGAAWVATQRLYASGWLKPEDRLVLFKTGSGLKYR